jgi:hypothetical protein
MSHSKKLEPFRAKSQKPAKKRPVGSCEPEYGPGYSAGRRLPNSNDQMKDARLPVREEPHNVEKKPAC